MNRFAQLLCVLVLFLALPAVADDSDSDSDSYGRSHYRNPGPSAAVPEPGALLVFGGGAALVAYRVRSRRR